MPDIRRANSTIGTSDVADIRIDALTTAKYAQAQGATSLVVVGASMGGTSALLIAGGVHAVRVASLSGPAIFNGLNATKAVSALKIPILLFAEHNPVYSDDAKALAKAAPAGVATLQIMEGLSHGNGMLTDRQDGQGRHCR